MTLGRLWDVLALLVIAFVIYRLLIAPRSLREASAFPAPRVSYQTLAGPPFVLAQHRGRVVFLDFWASWCEPCKAALPLVETYARSHPNVDVVPIDVGEPRAVVAAFARKHHMHRVAMDPQSLSSGFFQISGFPTMVVIDPQGRVRATWTGFNPAIELNMGNATRTLAGVSPPSP
ncbi:MAG TPA: TlpA disulfide reductase family protein [Candidatus Baltobacteraceae bacterium]